MSEQSLEMAGLFERKWEACTEKSLEDDMRLIESIIEAIKKEFGEDAVIYEKITEQEIQLPSFFVKILSDSLVEERAGSYRYRALAEVTYFDQKLSQRELEAIRLRIQLLLSNLPGLARAEKMETKEKEGFLATEATYTLFLSKQEKNSPMARLEQGNGKRKND